MRIRSDDAFEGGHPGFVPLEQVGSLGVFVEDPGLALLNPYADRVTRNVVALRQTMERLASEKLLRHLTLELDAV
jgi:hypothetical protein